MFEVEEFLQAHTLAMRFVQRCHKKHTYVSEQNNEASEHASIHIGVLGLQEFLEGLVLTPDSSEAKQLCAFLGRVLGTQGAISPTGATSRLLGVSSGIELETYSFEDQIALLATLQEHIGGAISKTVVLPANARVEQTRNVFELAKSRGLKGITVYRKNSLS
jgi:ribonucleotide reductase alpha subunit